MSHIDEGALHAYLDGALDEYPPAEAKGVREHLEACAECALRLEDERRVRSAAATILGHASPRVEAPSFEELKAYVKATRPAVGRVSVRLYRMGWAASVVLALGVGWLARGGELDRALGPGGLPGAAPLVVTDLEAGARSAPAGVALPQSSEELAAAASTATTASAPAPGAERGVGGGR
jgi:anti-sigma factor RsiW